MSWIKVEQSVVSHRKIIQLAEWLDIPEIYVVGHLVGLWTWCMDNAKDGILPDSKRTICKAAQFTGDPQEFILLLVDCTLIDVLENGELYVHNWHKHGGKLNEKCLKNAERQRLYRERLKSENSENILTLFFLFSVVLY